MDRKSIFRIVIIALFTALIAAGAFIRIPIPPVPITLQTLFAMLAACVLPPSAAVSCIIAYLLIGIIGIPVFTAGGGFAAIAGPTGGYLIGLLPAVLAASLVSKHMRGRAGTIIATVLATAIIYAAGVPWLALAAGLPAKAALAAGLLPFITGDVIKAVAVIIIAPSARERIMAATEDDQQV